jgi:glycosyltransferase involved in cell wall biosynthesis
MKILSLTAGAAQMYCGSCLRDNNLAGELLRQGHDVTLVPIYTPTKTDEANQSYSREILFGGISVYLQQHSALFRHTPRFLDRLWDSRWALKAASKRSLPVDPRFLGEMTVSMLQGDRGPLSKEFHKLEVWFEHQHRPDIVNLPNTLLIAMAPAIRRVFDGPIVSTLQGEDLYLEGLIEPYRTQSLFLIREQIRYIDGFVSISESYSRTMTEFLGLPPEKVFTVPVGVDPSHFTQAAPDGPFKVGYLARIAPEKGLHLLCEAWRIFRGSYSGPAELHAAGYLAPEHHDYFNEHRETPDFVWHGELDRAEKVNYLASLDAFCVPPVYNDPKALYVLEALSSGVPVVVPERMAPREHVEACGGGIVVTPDSPHAMAEAFLELAVDRQKARQLGAQGREGVQRARTLRQMAERTVAVYQSLLAPSRQEVLA